MFFKNLFFLFFLLQCLYSSGQNKILQQYIEEGLNSNLVLRQKNLSFENAMLALQRARSMYLPTLDFQTLYTTADGGRNINVPVGEMLNPVYATLNQLTGQNVFPHIKDQEINFLPKNYYDSRFRLSVPVFNPEIKSNREIHQRQLTISEKQIEVYERELVLEIKTTYYNYLSAQKAAEIYQSTVELAEEGKRTNERKVAAGTGLPAYVLRSETELEDAKAQLEGAKYQAENIRAYFNLLLNRDKDASIDIGNETTEINQVPREQDLSAESREELQSLNEAIALRETVSGMNKQVFLPRLNGFADLGSQAEQLKFNRHSGYYMIGLQLNVPIFSGGRNNLKIREAENDVQAAKAQRDFVNNQLNTAVTVAHNEVRTASVNYNAAVKKLEMAETYHRLIDKGYTAGVNTYIETVDARTQLTKAKIGASVSYYQLLSAFAKLERETASYPLPELK